MCNNDITKIKRVFLGHCDKVLLVAALDTFRLHRVYAVYRNVLSETSTLVSDIIMSFIEYCLYRVYNKLYVLKPMKTEHVFFVVVCLFVFLVE